MRMSKLRVLLLTMVITMCVVRARHVHPRSLVRLGQIEVEDAEKSDVTEIDGMPIDVIRNIKPTRFVPINNALFFKIYSPCEEGFERDFLGICREVWD